MTKALGLTGREGRTGKSENEVFRLAATGYSQRRLVQWAQDRSSWLGIPNKEPEDWLAFTSQYEKIMNRLFVLAFAGLITLPNVGCNLKPASTAILYLDNPSNTTVSVLVDGEPKATIPPRQFECVSVELGLRHIQFESDKEFIYSTKHTFDPNDIPLIPGSYLVNPVDSVCYCSTTATYGYDEQAKQLEQLITRVSVGGEDVPRRDLIPQFKRVLAEMQVFEATEPTRFEVQRYTLQPLPNSVKAMKHAVSRDRSALIRIPRELHDLIVELGEIEVPSENDMKTAAKLRLTVDTLIPFED